MNKPQLINTIAENSGVARKDVGAVLNALTSTIQSQVMGEGNVIRITSLGSFKRGNRAARVGRNPRTGEAVNIPAKTRLTFKPSASKS